MRNIWTIAANLVRRMVGQRRGLMTYLIIPCIIISVIISLTGNDGFNKDAVLYSNLDTGPAGAHVIAELEKTGDYNFVKQNDGQEVKQGVIDEKGQAGLIIPADYTAKLLAGGQSQIQIYELKASETSVTLKMKASELGDRLRGLASAASQASGGTAEARLASVLEQAGKHQVGSVRTDYNLYPRTGMDTVTGFMLMFLMAMVTSSVSFIMDDRKQRTMMRMYSAPVRSYEIAIGNFLGSLAVGIIQVAAVLAVARFGLGYNFGVPMPIYFLALAGFMLVSMGLASTAAGLIRNPNNTGMLNALILTPTCMLGGCFWPISIMPDYMQKAANFVPQKWAIEAAELAATGSGWSELWLPFAVLGLMAAILLAIGSAILRPSEAAI
ncbi:ABC transporter permease [Paenibacillus sp. HN-1]|uniref:ABC transporter permease n=1 Tax=Paenibacillus TaxID=44249 RepID=UPI001CA98AC5|nr:MULTISPECIES: ABC transporter permease [Paenibacillus]MBY9077549.1 ABC transporter permease [Paenibacillus sp. CGMCC 1.18879]MBY9087820.1 ABC transporter permease [Paenibacillus sinensis]